MSRNIAHITSAISASQLNSTGVIKGVNLADLKIAFADPVCEDGVCGYAEKSTSTRETCNGVNWYKFFIKRPQFLALEDEFTYEQMKSMFVVCLNIPGTKDDIRNFACFPSISFFLDYALLIPREKWAFFEIILGDRLQKLYFDIDIEIEKVPAGENLTVWSNRFLNCLISSLITVLKRYNVDLNLEKDLLIFSSNSDKKHSYHVVINNYYVNNCKCNIQFATEVKTEIDPVFRNLIDTKVYSSKQQLRLFGSSKIGKNRYKILHEFTYGIRSYRFLPEGETEGERFRSLFDVSCVTSVENCKPIAMSVESSFKDDLQMSGGEAEALTQEQTMAVLKAVALEHRMLFNIYKVSKVVGRMILLQRKATAFCTLCKRVHENENAFLSVSANFSVYFYCRRNDMENKYLCTVSFTEDLAKDHIAYLLQSAERVSSLPSFSVTKIDEMRRLSAGIHK